MRRNTGLATLLGVFFLVMGGCGAGGTKVTIQQSVYNPAVDASNLTAYKGKTIYFYSLTNNASDTTIWSYSSTDKKYYYEATPALQTFFWECFNKSFLRIGVRVLASPWTPGTESAKELQIVLNSVTDQKLVFTAILIKPGESSFQKQITVEVPAAQTTDIAELEKRSYKFMDEAFLTMVTDSEFKKAFLKK